MRSQIRTAIALACEGRSARRILADAVMVGAALAIAWLAACAFVLMEPLS